MNKIYIKDVNFKFHEIKFYKIKWQIWNLLRQSTRDSGAFTFRFQEQGFRLFIRKQGFRLFIHRQGFCLFIRGQGFIHFLQNIVESGSSSKIGRPLEKIKIKMQKKIQINEFMKGKNPDTKKPAIINWFQYRNI